MQFSYHVLLNFKKRSPCREEKDDEANEEEEASPPETEEPR
jgi:hypothetical protein